MLKLGGYINIIIAIGHMVGLFYADKMFEVTGIGEEMTTLAQIHSFLPYLLTLFVALTFLIFGLYGLSAGNSFVKLPFLKAVVFLIAAIYLLRGIGEFIYNFKSREPNIFLENIYSLIAIFIGLLYLVGGLNKWKYKKKI